MYMIGVVLLVLVSTAIVAGIYLNVYHYLIGEASDSYVPIEELEQNISNLTSQLADITSYQMMQDRVKDLNLDPLDAEHIEYLQVPGYIERQVTTLAPPPQPMVVNASTIDPEYKESLFEWVSDQVRKTVSYFSEAKP
jgi:hypothetical protein